MSSGEGLTFDDFRSSVFSSALGPLLIGGLVGAILYGSACIQTLIYYQRSSGDPLYLKLMVLVLCLSATSLSGGKNTGYLFSDILELIIAELPNRMFIYRVWRLSQRNIFLTWFIFSLSLLDLVCGIIITTKAFDTTFLGLHKISTLLYVDLAAVIAADALVSLSLCYYLHRSKPGLQKTDSLINALIMYAVNTGLLTAFDASAALVLYAVMPTNLIFIAFYLLLSKLYLNAYLASLNARSALQDNSDDGVSIHIGPFSGTRTRSTALSSDLETAIDKRDTLSIMVSTEVDTHVDPTIKGKAHTGRRHRRLHHPESAPQLRMPEVRETSPVTVPSSEEGTQEQIDLEWLKYMD
ncbi:hypothetical protein NLI96_g7627 [Meripilus lineatus]|uniref:DUF6534 domain-containing protein n=1 Tax=Meripilus lineatus TaxID=2056292 RepID=A0AAD5UYS9_9APHY|nr:hypothetical protein NLI96_g7627 [Physisporinus lineatus]